MCTIWCNFTVATCMLFTVLESLTELIQQANKHDIVFVYAISPGLDITYSSNKDLTILRRKLDQVRSHSFITVTRVMSRSPNIDLTYYYGKLVITFNHPQTSLYQFSLDGFKKTLLFLLCRCIRSAVNRLHCYLMTLYLK